MFFQIMFSAIIISAVLTLVSQRKHFLIALLRLEAITLITVGLMTSVLGNPAEIDTTLFIVVVSFAAVEARIGLSILVSISRKIGTELIQTLTTRKC